VNGTRKTAAQLRVEIDRWKPSIVSTRLTPLGGASSGTLGLRS